MPLSPVARGRIERLRDGTYRYTVNTDQLLGNEVSVNLMDVTAPVFSIGPVTLDSIAFRMVEDDPVPFNPDQVLALPDRHFEFILSESVPPETIWLLTGSHVPYPEFGGTWDVTGERIESLRQITQQYADNTASAFADALDTLRHFLNEDGLRTADLLEEMDRIGYMSNHVFDIETDMCINCELTYEYITELRKHCRSRTTAAPNPEVRGH